MSFVDQFKNDPMYFQEYALLAATEAVAQAMQETHTTKQELAEMMGRRVSYIQRFLEGPEHLELTTLAQMLYHMGYLVEISIRKRDKEPKK